MEQEKPKMTFFHFKFLLTIVVLKKQKKKKKEKNTQFLSKTWGGWGWLCF